MITPLLLAMYLQDSPALAAKAGGQKPELAIQGGHTDTITSICFSPDGQLAASSSNDGTVRIWDAKNGFEIRVIVFPNTDSSLLSLKKVLSVTFTPDGTQLACGREDGIVFLCSVSSGKTLKTIQTTQAMIQSLAFSPDGKMLATGARHHNGGNSFGGDSSVLLWNVSTDEQVRALVLLDMMGRKGVSGDLNYLRFSPDAKKIVVRHDACIYFYSVETGERLSGLRLMNGSVSGDFKHAAGKAPFIPPPRSSKRSFGRALANSNDPFEVGALAVCDVDTTLITQHLKL